MEQSDAESFEARVDAAMLDWRQGDIAQLESFTHIADLRRPVSQASRQAAVNGHSGGDLVRIGSSVEGLVVLTQTCDIVRSCVERPFIEACPLVLVDEATAEQAYAGERPRFAGLPHVGPNAVADLDRAMTLEKGALSLLQRRAGWTTDAQLTRFQQILARHRNRFAFPNDFNETIRKLTEKIASRHGKATSPEGQLFAEVRQIRAHVAPNWEAANIDVRLVFILPEAALPPLPDSPELGRHQATTMSWLSAKRRSTTDIATRLLAAGDPTEQSLLWQRLVDGWVGALVPKGVVRSVVGEVASEREYSVRDYWDSVQLDLDHLSLPD